MEEKKKNSSVVVIILLVVLLVLSVGYIAYDKLYATNKDVNSSNEEKNSIPEYEELNIKSDFVIDLNERSRFANSCGDIDEILKKDKMNVSEFTNAQRLEIASEIAYRYDDDDDGYKEVIDEEDLIKAFKKIFGNNATYTVSDFYNPCPDFKYDKSIKRYITRSEEIIDAKKYNDRIEIITALAFSSDEGVFADVKMKNKISSLDDNFKLISRKDQLKQYKYTYTYDKETGNYYYYSIEKIKK